MAATLTELRAQLRALYKSRGRALDESKWRTMAHEPKVVQPLIDEINHLVLDEVNLAKREPTIPRAAGAATRQLPPR